MRGGERERGRQIVTAAEVSAEIGRRHIGEEGTTLHPSSGVAVGHRRCSMPSSSFAIQRRAAYYHLLILDFPDISPHPPQLTFVDIGHSCYEPVRQSVLCY